MLEKEVDIAVDDAIRDIKILIEDKQIVPGKPEMIIRITK